MIRACLMLAGVIGLSGAAVGAERFGPEQNQCNLRETTMDIVDCLQGRTKLWDQRLNRVWKELTAFLADEKPRLAALRTAEQAWLKFRDANCAYQYSQDGTIKQIATAGCMLDMTQKRVMELQDELPR